jgi:hypothetical protein
MSLIVILLLITAILFIIGFLTLDPAFIIGALMIDLFYWAKES